MFKKDRDLTERSKTLLKNKEVRNLRAEVVKQFPGLDEETASSVIPNKAQIVQTKLASKTVVYSIDDLPYLFDIAGRNNLCPTLHFLWACTAAHAGSAEARPSIIPCFAIHGPVSEYIMNGADLMAPGIATIRGLEMLKEGDKVCIRIIGNPMPFAVGEALIGAQSLSGKPKGKAVVVHHLFGDLLCKNTTPNGGFSMGAKCIYPVNDEEIDEVPSAAIAASVAGKLSGRSGAVNGIACGDTTAGDGVVSLDHSQFPSLNVSQVSVGTPSSFSTGQESNQQQKISPTAEVCLSGEKQGKTRNETDGGGDAGVVGGFTYVSTSCGEARWQGKLKKNKKKGKQAQRLSQEEQEALGQRDAWDNNQIVGDQDDAACAGSSSSSATIMDTEAAAAALAQLALQERETWDEIVTEPTALIAADTANPEEVGDTAAMNLSSRSAAAAVDDIDTDREAEQAVCGVHVGQQQGEHEEEQEREEEEESESNSVADSDGAEHYSEENMFNTMQISSVARDGNGSKQFKIAERGERDEGGDIAVEEKPESPQNIPQDELAVMALIRALKYIVRDKQLPMLISTFWSLMQRCLPDVNQATLEIKKTTFKKVSHFMAHCAITEGSSSGVRESLQLLRLKDVNGVASITAVNRNHALFRKYKVDNPEMFRETVLGEAAADVTAPLSAAASTSKVGNASIGLDIGKGLAGNNGRKSQKIILLDLHKLPKHLRDVFGFVRGEHGDYLKMDEVRDLVMMYLQGHKFAALPGGRMSLPHPSGMSAAAAAVAGAGVSPSVDKAQLLLVAESFPTSADRDAYEAFYKIVRDYAASGKNGVEYTLQGLEAAGHLSSTSRPTATTSSSSTEKSKEPKAKKKAATSIPNGTQQTMSILKGSSSYSSSRISLRMIGQGVVGFEDDEAEAEGEEEEIEKVDPMYAIDTSMINRRNHQSSSMGSSLGSTVAGVWMSSSSIDPAAGETTRSGTGAGSGAGFGSERSVEDEAWGTLSAGENEERMPVGTGGWGFDKSKTWKPIELSLSKVKAHSSIVNNSNNAGKKKQQKSVRMAEHVTQRDFLSSDPVADSAYHKGRGGEGLDKQQRKNTARSASAAMKHQEEQQETALEMTRKDILLAIVSKMSPYYAVIGPSGVANIRSGAPPRVKIMVETRVGNKTVTILRNLEVFGLDLAQFARDCQKKFACSVSVSTVPGQPKDKEVVLQGNFGFEMDQYLLDSAGLPKHLTEASTGKGVKPKKKTGKK